MSLRTDQRGQAIQVGAVLLFAILIIGFSSYQAVIIPEDNRRVEFNHNQEVQEHLTELRSAVLGAADSRSVRSVTVALGTTYPSRTLGLNPGPPGGSLRTVGTDDPMVNLTIENATVDGETGDFWNGSQRAYNTGAIAYDPVYNRYDEAPTTVYEHSVLYNRFPSSNTLVLANQTLLDGDRLAVTTVDGSLDRTSSRSTSVDVRPVSSGGESVLLEEQDTASPITLEFTSRLSVDRWDRILSDQDNVVDVSGSSSPTDSDLNRIRVELATGVDYRLGMTKAAVGQGATGEGSAYITDIAGDGATVQRGSSQQLTLAVRDRYNNPVAGVSLNGSVDGSNAGSLDEDQKTTGPDGRVTFTYRTTSSTSEGDHAINFTTETASRLSGMTFDAGTSENVSMQVTVTQSGSGGGAYDVDWTDPSSESANSGDSFETCEANVCTWNVGESDDDSLTLNATLSPPFGDIDLEFAVSNSTVGTVTPDFEATDDDGAATTELTANSNGTVEVLASGNEGSDTVEITVIGVSSDPGPPGGLAYDDENQNGQYDDGETTYTRSELESGLDDGGVDLVVPSDVGTISSSSIAISTNSISSDVDIEAINGDMDLSAGGGNMDLNGHTITVENGDPTLSADGAMILDGATLDTNDGEVNIDGGTVTVVDADITATNNALTMTSNGEIDATDAALSSTTDDLDLNSNGDIRLHATEISAPNGDASATLGGGNNVIYVQDALIDDADNNLEYSPNGADVIGEPASGSVS